MINENIKRLRKARKMSQEEVAVHLNVVRQTISKYESGLSVPDANMIIKMAELFEVPVTQILGIEIDDNQINDLQDELARLNKELVKKEEKENRILRIKRVRGKLLFFSFAALICAYSIENTFFAIVLTGICIIFCAVIFYRNLGLLTKNMKLNTLKKVTIINVLLLIICILFVILSELGYVKLTESGEKYLAAIFITLIIIYSGIIATRLPFNQYTGLRLPWTVQDEETWDIAHRVLGIIAVPIALFYLIGTKFFMNFEAVTLIVVIAWIGIPAVISFMFYYRKFHK